MKKLVIKNRVLNYLPRRYKHFIREKAIKRATTRLLVAGNHPSKLSPEDLETVVKEEEDKIKSSIREKGLLAVLTVLGLTLFG